MKIRGRLVNRTLGFLGGAVARTLIRTQRLDETQIRAEVDPRRTGKPVGRIGVVWHEGLLLPTVVFGGYGGVTLISQSGDGDIATAIAESLGWRVVRGSSSRGGMSAVRELVASAGDDNVDIAITADGPRGPRRVLKDGVLYVAARTGLPLIPMGIAFGRPWRFNSWDRFAVPKPFGRACIVFGADMVVPPNADRMQIEQYKHQLQLAMEDVTARAEAAVGERPQSMDQPEALRRAA